jgi:hypothetical protein
MFECLNVCARREQALTIKKGKDCKKVFLGLAKNRRYICNFVIKDCLWSKMVKTVQQKQL